MSDAPSLKDISADIAHAPPGKLGLFVKQLWNGGVPLFTTYWFFGVFATILLNVAIRKTVAGIIATHPNIDDGQQSLLFYASYLLAFAYQCFISVAIWRSATSYAHDRAALDVFAYLAKAAVVFGFVMAICCFFVAHDRLAAIVPIKAALRAIF